MSRSGYSEDYDDDSDYNNAGQLYEANVQRSLRGERGQKLLRDALSALDAMHVKELIAGKLEYDGQVCMLGTVGVARKIDMSKLDVDDAGAVARAFGISECLARRVMSQNDDDFAEHRNETPAQRWERMRGWVVANIRTDAAENGK